jgi:hypothetical protein
MDPLLALQDLGGVLTSSTWVPLGAAVICVGASVAGYKWLRDQFDELRKGQADRAEKSATRELETVSRLDRIIARLDALERRDPALWTVSDQIGWEREMARLNPTLKTPSVREVIAGRIPGNTR